MKKVRVQSYQHIQLQIRKKKIESKNTPKKLESSPTKHFTESSFLLVSDPLEDLNFRFFGLCFFQQIFMKKLESRAYSAADSPEKDRVQNTPKKVRKRWPPQLPYSGVKERSSLPSQNEGREASSNPQVFGSGRSSRPAEGRGPRGTGSGES